MIRRNREGHTELVLLDHGLYEELSVSVRQSLCNLWKSIVLNDHVGMKRYAANLGIKGQLLHFLVYLRVVNFHSLSDE